jgi:hypothetical protein
MYKRKFKKIYLSLCILVGIFQYKNLFSVEPPSLVNAEIHNSLEETNPEQINWGEILDVTRKEPKKKRRISFYLDFNNDEKYISPNNTGQYSVAGKLGIHLHLGTDSGVAIVSETVFKQFLRKKLAMPIENGFECYQFDLEIWNCYKASGTNLYIIIPKDYDMNDEVELTVKTISSKRIQKIHLPVFKSNNWIKYQSSSILMDLIDFIAANKQCVTDNPASQIKSLFFTVKDLEDSKSFKKMREINWAVKKRIRGSGETNLLEQGINLSHLLHRGFNIFVIGHGLTNHSIAGMPIQYAKEYFRFLNNDVNTKFVLVASCYSGGINLKHLPFKEMISSPKYTLVISSIGESVTTAFIGVSHGIGKDYDVKSFFDSLDRKDPLNKTLENLTISTNWFYNEDGINSFPQVWIPGTGWLQPIDICPNIFRITQSLAQAKKLDNGEIFINSSPIAVESNALIKKEILAIMVQPQIVTKSLIIGPILKNDGWSNDLWKCFPVTSSYPDFRPHHSINNRFFFETPSLFSNSISRMIFYPSIISTQKRHGIWDSSMHFFNNVTVNSFETNSRKRSGLLHFIRDSMLNPQKRRSRYIIFFKNLSGYNDFSEILAMMRLEAKMPIMASTDEQKDYIRLFDSREDKSEFEAALTSNIEKEITLENVIIETETFQAQSNPARSNPEEWIVKINFDFPDTNGEKKHWQMNFSFQSPTKRADGTEKTRREDSAWKFEKIPNTLYESYLQTYPEVDGIPFAEAVKDFDKHFLSQVGNTDPTNLTPPFPANVVPFVSSIAKIVARPALRADGSVLAAPPPSPRKQLTPITRSYIDNAKEIKLVRKHPTVEITSQIHREAKKWDASTIGNQIRAFEATEDSNTPKGILYNLNSNFTIFPSIHEIQVAAATKIQAIQRGRIARIEVFRKLKFIEFENEVVTQSNVKKALQILKESPEITQLKNPNNADTLLHIAVRQAVVKQTPASLQIVESLVQAYNDQMIENAAYTKNRNGETPRDIANGMDVKEWFRENSVKVKFKSNLSKELNNLKISL